MGGGGGGEKGDTPLLRVDFYSITYEPLFSVPSPPLHLRKNRCSPTCVTSSGRIMGNGASKEEFLSLALLHRKIISSKDLFLSPDDSDVCL